MIFSLAITGPTASGKTALSISLAKAFGAEIVSCDSMQIYKEMDIGTAKATPAEQSEVPHHLLDVVSPSESFSVEEYRCTALRVAEEITARGKTPIFVGGTGLYVDSLTRGVSLDSPESDPEYRDRILASLKTEEDITALWERLLAVDPESAEKIHKNNVKRVIRALEIYEKTGKPKSLLDKETKTKPSEIFVGMITLDFHNRENLYLRVDKRVDVMIAEGLVGEARSLYESGFLKTDSTAAQAIGYKELLPYLKGVSTLFEATEKIKLSSRRYAKRQLTWFRHEADARRLFIDSEDGRMKDFSEIKNEALLLASELLK
jgi:tRNA dimethylallyltransferase